VRVALASLVAALLLPAGLTAQGVIHDPAPLRLVFTGDINIGTRTLDEGLPPDSGRGLFAQVDTLLRGDLVVGNFEGVLSDSGESSKCAPKATRCYAFATPTWLAPRLLEAGFTHLNLANNHANDYGLLWREHTEATFRHLGVTVYGPAGQVAITPLLRDGRMTLVGIVGFATYPHSANLLDIPASAALVDSVRPLVDVLVVTFHGGTEGATATRVPEGPEFLAREPRGNLRRFARAVIDAGADAVVGHGPHVLRGIEFYKGRPIAYSLGNFLTYKGFSMEGVLGLTGVLTLDLDANGGFRAGRLASLRQRPDSGLGPDSSGASLALVRRVSRLDFPGTAARFEADGSFTGP
jgi:hypothetical protein